jgi:hypothetical protein
MQTLSPGTRLRLIHNPGRWGRDMRQRRLWYEDFGLDAPDDPSRALGPVVTEVRARMRQWATWRRSRATIRNTNDYEVRFENSFGSTRVKSPTARRATSTAFEALNALWAFDYDEMCKAEHDYAKVWDRHYETQPCTVCKTSIPGSNPGGASKIPRKFARLAVCLRPRAIAYCSEKRSNGSSCSKCDHCKSLHQDELSACDLGWGGGSKDLQICGQGIPRSANLKQFAKSATISS